MTIYIYKPAYSMYHEEKNCRADIKNFFIENEMKGFLSEHEDEIAYLIACLADGGVVTRTNNEELCDDYEQVLEEYIAERMDAVKVDEGAIESYSKKYGYDWGD